MKKASLITGALLALLVYVAFPSSAQATDVVSFRTVYGTGTNLWVKMETETPGAIIFFTSNNGLGYPADPTHNGSTPGSGTIRYYGMAPIPYNQIRYFAAIAWTEDEGDSAMVTYWEQPNPNY